MARYIDTAVKSAVTVAFGLVVGLALGGGARSSAAPRTATHRSASAPSPAAPQRELAAVVTRESVDSPVDLSRLLELPTSHWFASTDPLHHNNDFVLLTPGETRRVPLAAGKLERLWSTASQTAQLKLALETGPPGVAPLPLWDHEKAQTGNYSDRAYTLIPGSAGAPPVNLMTGATLVATNTGPLPNKWFYQVTVRPVSHLAAAPPPAEYQVDHKLVNLVLAAGEEKVVESWMAPAEITQITARVRQGPANSLHLLRMHAAWDGQPAVDASLAGLAGQMAGTGPVSNAIAAVSSNHLELRWPMPFARATVSLENTGSDPITVLVGIRDQALLVPPSPFRFCAVEQSLTPHPGAPVPVLAAQGDGALVGLALSITPKPGSPRRSFAYLEGNESITADGAKREGTGTEDFFSSAWYFPDTPFALPYQGMTFKSKEPPAVSAYRFLLPDPVTFHKSLRFDFEHGNGNNTSDLLWNWTVVWYQKAPLHVNAAVPQEAGTADSGTSEVLRDRKGLIGYVLIGGLVVGLFSYMTRRARRLRRS